MGHLEDAPSTPDATITVENLSQATTTLVQASNDSPTYGDSLTFTATVAAESPGSGTPSGSVQFLVDGSTFGSPVTMVDGVAVSDPIGTLGAGPHTISAVYSGDDSFSTSTSDDQTLDVARAHLTVTADDQDMDHGDVVPP